MDLSPSQTKEERDMKIGRVKELGNALREVVGHRYSLLIAIPNLAAALLIVSTFGKDLISLQTKSLKIILTVLFLCIPAAFFGLLAQTRLDHSSILKSIYEIAGLEPDKISYPWHMRFLSSLPLILTSIVLIIILVIIISLWGKDLISLI